MAGFRFRPDYAGHWGIIMRGKSGLRQRPPGYTRCAKTTGPRVRVAQPGPWPSFRKCSSI